MIDKILNLDKEIFFYINTKISNNIIDSLMVMFSNKYIWIIIAIIIILWNVYKKNYPFLILVCLIIIGVSFNDWFSYNILKPFFNRLRPCHEFKDIVRVVSGCGGMMGFPSNHASNSMVITVMFFLFKKIRIGFLILFLTFIVGLSRVYLGVHYPLDVIGGYIIGSLWAVITFGGYIMIKKVYKKYKKI